jgi:hypothetical protein
MSQQATQGASGINGRGDHSLIGTIQRQIAERRFSALAAAVREHEAKASRHTIGARPHDVALYRRLRQIIAEA